MAPSPSPTYPGSANESHGFPWPQLEIACQQDLTCEGRVVTPEINARMEKGFFVAPDGSWTCYRRNYLAVLCSFQLHPHIPTGKLFLRGKQVQATGLRLAAAIADEPTGSGGKPTELVQFTAKRDQDGKTNIDVVKMLPSTSPQRVPEQSIGPQGVYQLPLTSFQATGVYASPVLPLQTVEDAPLETGSTSANTDYHYGSLSSAQLPLPGQAVSHTFERVQFKQATANNGKRRASQQFYHLVVELYADTRAPGAKKPNWEKLASLVSEKLVVRGRSPSHYKDERPDSGPAGAGGNASGPSQSAGPSGGPYNLVPSSSSLMGGAAGGSISGFRASHHYDYEASPYKTPPSDGHDPSTPHSHHEDYRYYDESKPSFDDDADMEESDNYTYILAPLYEPVTQRQDSGYSFFDSIKHEYSPYGTSEPRELAVRAEYPHAMPGPNWYAERDQARLRSVSTSRGWYPTDLSGPQT